MIAPRVKAPATQSADPIQASPLALQPELLQAFLRLYGTLWSHGELDPGHQGDRAHPQRAHDRLPDLQGDPVRGRAPGGPQRGPSSTAFAMATSRAISRARQKLVLRYVDAFLASPGEIDGELRRELLAHFTPAQLVELTAAVALFMGFSKIAVALGGLPDTIPVHEQPTPTCPAPG